MPGGRRCLAAASREAATDTPQVPPRGSPSVRPEPPMSLKQMNLGFIGWGAMAQAVSLGVLGKGLTEPGRMMCTDVVPAILEAAKKEGLRTSTCNRELVEWADMVVVAVKPQVVDQVIGAVAPHWKKDTILVSICAGVTIDTYRSLIRRQTKVVRVMPNSPCLIGEAATAYAGSKHVTEQELDLVHDMFGAVGGATFRVPEYLLNAVTGLSGSGPAYVYMMIQALSDAGVHGGLPRNVAQSLATQTVIGAARMVEQSGQHPAVLKEAVTSPAGTTIAGVRKLESMGFNAAVFEAVEAARVRSEELSKTPDFLHEKPAFNSSTSAP